MSLAMTKQERQAFLADVHVGVISIELEGAAPLAAPIWYDYAPERGVRVITGKDSRKGPALARARRFTLVAQSEQPPFYKYVSVSGPVVSMEPADLEAHSRPMARRYFGKELGDLYVSGGGREENLVFTMRPERWLTVDYAKMQSAGAPAPQTGSRRDVR
jgi:nitroimidazol reductase NimA-like FMN-containing flavoprotein (pyridoxamine 5'-phosphate oxidase superfamily)